MTRWMDADGQRIRRSVTVKMAGRGRMHGRVTRLLPNNMIEIDDLHYGQPALINADNVRIAR